MKSSFLFAGLLLVLGVSGQNFDQAIKDMTGGRIKKAVKDLEAAVAQNPASPEANYWLGQAYLADKQIQKAKDLYAKAMSATGQSPLLVAGTGHVEVLEGKMAEAKAHFDGAILTTGNKKNKKYGEPNILNAIVRANADGSSKVGDAAYAVEKAAQSEELLGATADMFVNLGIIHLKGGGENGGQAKRSFEKALTINPNFAPAYLRIGRIFESQRNSEMYLENYQKSISADPTFAPGYLELYDYWANRDVNKAKEYLDLFVANADKDKETDYFYADYLFRAGRYEESIKKGKEIESTYNGEKFPKVNKLYSFNYDRLKDSVQALQYMEKFINEEDPERLSADDYTLLAGAYLKVPGNVVKAETAAEKAIALDSTVAGKVSVMETMAAAYAAQQNWEGQYKWLDRKNAVKPDNSARNYYFMADAAHKAKNFDAAQRVANNYIRDYPEQAQGYFLKWRSAIAADPDTSKGSALEAIDQYTGFLMKDTAKNKRRIINNHGYKIYYYMVKAQNFQKALESANAILALDPADSYGLTAKTEAEKFIKAASARGGKSGAPAPAPSPGKPNQP